MHENLTFHFEGSLADSHQMNFYEAARFQYAAARLLVKLAQFRKTGRFSQKISSKSNFDVNLRSQTDGSFNINVEDPGQPKEDQFVNMTLADLVAYVSERVIEKLDEETLLRTSELQATKAAPPKEAAGHLINAIASSVANGERNLEDVPDRIQRTVRRRVAEIYRDSRLLENKSSTSKIDTAREQKLIAMAAPLVSEMATALRRSAETLEVTSSAQGASRPVLFLDEKMASEIETAKVDTEITSLLCDVIQFNKDNGWGKLKIENGTLTVSFSIPYDLLPSIKQRLIDTMKRDQVYLQTYFVRDRGGQVIRLIVAGILDTPSM